MFLWIFFQCCEHKKLNSSQLDWVSLGIGVEAKPGKIKPKIPLDTARGKWGKLMLLLFCNLGALNLSDTDGPTSHLYHSGLIVTKNNSAD